MSVLSVAPTTIQIRPGFDLLVRPYQLEFVGLQTSPTRENAQLRSRGEADCSVHQMAADDARQVHDLLVCFLVIADVAECAGSLPNMA